MNKVELLESGKFQFLALTIGCFIANPLGDHLSVIVRKLLLPDSLLFNVDFLSNFFFMRLIPITIAYGLVGSLLGYGLWLAFKKAAKRTALYTPLATLLASHVQVYINFLDRISGGGYSPYKLLGYQLTSYHGYYLFIVLPIAVIATIGYLDRKKTVTT